jgi:hypothetical protein
MDTVINYNKAASFQKNLPSLEPCPNFTNIWALHKHVIKALSQLFCPQRAIHGWLGLAMDPATYLLLEGKPFIVSVDPRAVAIYPWWAAPTTIKMIDAMFLCNKNYFLSYKNIARACFCMFDANIATQFKVSNTPLLTGWNSTMTIIEIFDQLQDSYGKPNMMTLFNNSTLFRSPMTPGNSPEMLFYRIEQCQEIQWIRKVSYLDNQIFDTVVRILVTSNMFSLKKFNGWE